MALFPPLRATPVSYKVIHLQPMISSKQNFGWADRPDHMSISMSTWTHIPWLASGAPSSSPCEYTGFAVHPGYIQRHLSLSLVLWLVLTLVNDEGTTHKLNHNPHSPDYARFQKSRNRSGPSNHAVQTVRSVWGLIGSIDSAASWSSDLIGLAPLTVAAVVPPLVLVRIPP